MSSLERQPTGKAYWRSLDELADTPRFRRFVENEFPGLADRLTNPFTRRQFLKLMGASMALAGLAGCRWPEEKILPFNQRPDGRMPGIPERFATTMELGGVAAGLLVSSYDGRPIKIEGNPLHPTNLGACGALAQASLLELYDPDRSTSIIRREGGQELRQTWDDFAEFARDHFGGLRQQQGAGLYILSEDTSSPSILDLRTRFSAIYPQARWLTYEPLARDNERAGAQLAFGRSLRTHYKLDQADIIVSLDADLLHTYPAALRYAHDFAQQRSAADGTMNRLYVAESAVSITGAMADHRAGVRAGDIGAIAGRLAAELFIIRGLSLPDGLGQLRPILDNFTDKTEHEAWIGALADDLMEHLGQSVIAVGPRQPADVHALAHVLNAALGNNNTAVFYTAEPEPQRLSDVEAIQTLANDMRAGQVSTLVILGGNPVFNAPADVKFAEVLANVETSIHLSAYADETSQLCRWHLPRAHYLECWGDARAYDGTILVAQPLIEPLHGGKSALELLGIIIGESPARGYELVRRTLQGTIAASDFEAAWRRLLHDGVLGDSAYATVSPDLAGATLIQGLSALAPAMPVNNDELEVVLVQDASIYDGRFANNGWLQEAPDPLTTLTWDNAALLSTLTADRLGLAHGDLVTLEHDGRSIEAPVLIMPGQAPNSIALALGYGREKCGAVGDGVGVDTYALRTTGAMHILSGVQLTKMGRKYTLATTQDHYAIDTQGKKQREQRVHTLIREANLDYYRYHPDFISHDQHHPPLISLWEEHTFEGHQWAMAIDLSLCIGCGACVVACQAENNIPIVGKDDVAEGREMHWMRVDRYFSDDPAQPEIVHQPVTCHHCELAPCEQVCPVAATVHDDEGLNTMVYNRCVGTRYCSNNCPYKVRRFNYFNYHRETSDVQKMMYNPEVTVRSRGVMEKCTFCIQRIKAVTIPAKNDRRPVTDGEIVPACAQTCPTRAIVFGDLSDPDSRVRKLHEHNRAYAMLGELNIKPRTKYLAKLRNQAPELIDKPGGSNHA